MTTYSIGIDIGGTFTDVVCAGSDGSFRLMKVPTTRHDPAAAVRTAIEKMRAEWGVAPGDIARFVHGSTVATNAVIERKGARIGVIATRGFKDVLEIGRQMRHAMYDLVLSPETPVFLAPGARRKEVTERVSASGDIVTPLADDEVRACVAELVADGVEAIAVVFLFSFLNPAHELRVRDIVAEAHPGLMVSLSCEVDPAFREYERTAVTAFDAYIKPVVARYLAAMARDLAALGIEAPLQIMQSRGGIASAETAVRRPVRLFLSGPAAGVVGGVAVGRTAGISDLITIDIGGTSCDIALVTDGEPLIRAEGVIDGYAVRVPMVDVSAIGSGGGSIATLDGAGALRVGPESAGSEPGPACYGRGGTHPTVTDASLVLGYLDPEYFAGGSLRLDPECARHAIETEIARPMGLSVERAALGIHRVVNAQMAEAMRLVSIGRGIDPRRYTLLPLGGAGPIHAAALAAELGIGRILVPPYPGVLSAAGLLGAPVEHEVSAAWPQPLAGASWGDVRAVLTRLDAACAELMRQERLAPGAASVRYAADLCYSGQGYHLEIPLHEHHPDPLARLYRDFLAAHDRVYGHATDAPARIVNLRAIHRAEATANSAPTPSPSMGEGRGGGDLGHSLTRGAGGAAVAPPPPNPPPSRGRAGASDGPDIEAAAAKGRRVILTDAAAGFETADVYDRAGLAAGAVLSGPAVIDQPDTTILVPRGWRCSVVEQGLLLLEREAVSGR